MAVQEGATWDEDKVFGCVCDSSWAVGLGSGDTQEPEWFGPDCSYRKSKCCNVVCVSYTIYPQCTVNVVQIVYVSASKSCDVRPCVCTQ